MGALGLKTETLVLAAVAVGAALWWASRNASDLGYSAGSAAVDLATGVLTGGVESIGEAVGIPKTNVSKGQAELDAGNYWAASFDLPAGDFISGAWKRLTN